jgi:hypothetical protein
VYDETVALDRSGRLLLCGLYGPLFGGTPIEALDRAAYARISASLPCSGGGIAARASVPATNPRGGSGVETDPTIAPPKLAGSFGCLPSSEDQIASVGPSTCQSWMVLSAYLTFRGPRLNPPAWALKRSSACPVAPGAIAQLNESAPQGRA